MEIKPIENVWVVVDSKDKLASPKIYQEERAKWRAGWINTTERTMQGFEDTVLPVRAEKVNINFEVVE